MLRLLLIYIALFLFGTILCILLFHTPLFSGMDVFFYRGLLIILCSGLASAACMEALRRRKKELQITVRDLLLLFVSFVCIQTLFFTHVPVTAERSVSVFMLGYMADHDDHAFTGEELEDFFISCYVQDRGAVAKRLHEQEVTGTIVRDGGGYRITDAGKRLMDLYERVAVLYGLDDDIVHPERRITEGTSSPAGEDGKERADG